MIIHKKCEIEELPEGVIGQVGLDQLVHYTKERSVSDNEKIQKILDYADREGLDLTYYSGCSEAGYDDIPVVAADWNGPSKYWNRFDHKYEGRTDILTDSGLRRKKMANLAKLVEYLEKKGAAQLQWEDEWMACSDCYKAVRSSPDSYCWEPSYVWTSDCEIVCRNCWENFIDDIIDYYKSDEHYGFSNKALPSDFCEILENQGFTCWQDRKPWENEESCAHYETGWHPGQNDDPKKVFAEIMKDSGDWEVIFVITSRGQFDIGWSAFTRLAK